MILYEITALLLLLTLHCSHSLTLRKEHAIYDPVILSAAYKNCDPSTIPVMSSFDIQKFSGTWFELAKSAAGYIDVSDGAWKIEGTNTSNKFLYSGRDNNGHCIRPIKGSISAMKEPPGMLNLKYHTYSTRVDETIRVLFTDYVSVAVIYTCMYQVHHEICHAAGLFGAIWTRKPHVDVEVYDKAVQYLEMACVHKTTLFIRNVVGPCRVEDLEFRIDDFPAPDYCYQPIDEGSCRGSIQRYYFDPKEKTCRIFTFGGCGGNKNNFLSLPECQKNCITESMKDPVCLSTAKCGIHCSPCCTEDGEGCVQCSCEHIVVDDYLNCLKSPAQCPDDCEVENFYPGCHICRCGGDHKIEDGSQGVCNEVKAVGKCNEKIERYYYNSFHGECERFTYSGCNGNNNNFKTLQECKSKCQDQPTMKAIPIEDDDDDSSVMTYVNVWLVISLSVLLIKLQSLS